MANMIIGDDLPPPETPSHLTLRVDRFRGEGQARRSITRLLRVVGIAASRWCLTPANAYQHIRCPIVSNCEDHTDTRSIIFIFQNAWFEC